MDRDVGILIAELGFPIVSALGVGVCLWVILRWMMRTLHGEIQDVKTRIADAQKEQLDILIKLIDRVRLTGDEHGDRLRQLEDSVIRTEVLIRTAYNLEQEWGRIGRSGKPKGE